MATRIKASSVNHPSKVILRILFKEILQQITPEDAESLNKAYRDKREIGFRIRENSRGIGYKTAFQPFVTPEEKPVTVEIKTQCWCGRELKDGECFFFNHKN